LHPSLINAGTDGHHDRSACEEQRCMSRHGVDAHVRIAERQCALANAVGLAKNFEVLQQEESKKTPAASDTLSDIAPEQSATVGKRKKADEKIVVGEMAESERLRGTHRLAVGSIPTLLTSLRSCRFSRKRFVYILKSIGSSRNTPQGRQALRTNI
jgi:hypothetical protein